MRRPLFWAALLIVIVAGIRLKSGGPEKLPPGAVSAQSLGACQELTVSGQVYRKDGLTLYLQDISVYPQRTERTEDLSKESISHAELSRQIIPCTDNIICKLDQAERTALGSYVTLKGDLAPVPAATNPGEFDAAAYYRTLGVGGRLSRARLLACGKECWPLREWLYEVRLSLEARLYRALPAEQAGTVCALLLGDRGGLEESVEDLYRRSGILHILSISSLHITILGVSLYKLLRRLRIPVGPSALAGCILLLLYGGLTGFGVSACRAIGMYLIRMLGEVLGRTYDMLTALGVMGALMVLKNPCYLDHSGFMLSFSSVLGVSVLRPALQGPEAPAQAQTDQKGPAVRFLVGAKESIKKSALASLSVALATLPVQLRYYYEVPVYSVLVNLLVLPLVRPLMLAGLMTVSFPGAVLPAAAVGAILRWYEWLCGSCVRLPFHTWNPGCPELWQIGAYYLVLAGAVLARRRIGGRRRRGAQILGGELPDPPRYGLWRKAATVTALVCGVLLLGLRPGPRNRVTFLDVGQGDCILVQTGAGQNYLFDCGSTGRTGVGEYVLVPFLKYHGIRVLDAVFISHPDADHADGIRELLALGQKSGVTVRQLILPGIAEELRQGQFGELLEAARGAGQRTPVEIRYVSAGDAWECRTARFTCLHPSAGWDSADENAYSECFYVEFLQEGKGPKKAPRAATLLLTGDVEGEGERALLEQLYQRGIGQVDVLKVAHHGSRESTSEELLKLIRPRYAVISCGESNRYGHPHGELLDRLDRAGSTVLQTKDRGAVILQFP